MKVWIVTIETTYAVDFDSHKMVKCVHATKDGCLTEMRETAAKYGSEILEDEDCIAFAVYYDNKGNILNPNHNDWSVFKIAKAKPFELLD